MGDDEELREEPEGTEEDTEQTEEATEEPEGAEETGEGGVDIAAEISAMREDIKNLSGIAEALKAMLSEFTLGDSIDEEAEYDDLDDYPDYDIEELARTIGDY